MLKKAIGDILRASADVGWVLESDAKRILQLAGLEVPKFKMATKLEEVERYAEEIGYPVILKVVSPKILHKTDVGGVVAGIDNKMKLQETFNRFSTFENFAGMLIEETLYGLELIVGAKMDYQFGPVILLGIGGTGVEIYRDTSLRLAPLEKKDVESMIRGLKGHRLIEGYRGHEPINLHELTSMLMIFSSLVVEIEGLVESIDLNPVMCTSKRCVTADARIILKLMEDQS